MASHKANAASTLAALCSPCSGISAAAIIRELQRLGRRVPEDIRVTGFDNMDFSALLKPSLTTVDQRNGAVADAAVFMIRHYLDNRKFPENISIKPRLVLRESA